MNTKKANKQKARSKMKRNVLFSQQAATSSFEISANTIEAMDQSMEHFKLGEASKPIKL